jgi:hypothetical protein
LETCSSRRVGQGLGEDDIGLFHEHDGFAKALALGHDFDNLFAALRRGEGQLDLAIDQQMEASAGVALVKQDIALVGVDLAGRAGNAGDFFRASPLKRECG